MRITAIILTAVALTACGTPHSQQVRNDARDRFDRANAQVVFDQALQAFHAGQFEPALQHVDKAITRFPKDGGYVVPVKDVVRNGEGLEVGDVVTVRLTVGV